MWVLAGRTESNLPKVKRVLVSHGLKFEVFFLCYNSKQMMQYGHWKRQRGLANSKSLEVAILAFKQKVPKEMPKERSYVDQGSVLFNQIVRNVPVLAPKMQAYVSRAVREVSLSNMAGLPHSEDPVEQKKENDQEKDKEDDDNTELHQPKEKQPDQAEQTAFVASHIKKRKLYRQLSGTEVPWFPHDNDPALLQEFCFEAGKPRWVFHGTPAGGAGIHGCFEMGCSVVALCYDDHHRVHLEKFLLQRAVEAMASGMSMVFKDSALQARSAELHLDKTSENSKNDRKRAADKKVKKETDPDKEKKNKRKGAKTLGKKKQDKKSKAKAKSSSSSSTSTGESEVKSSSEETSKKSKK